MPFSLSPTQKKKFYKTGIDLWNIKILIISLPNLIDMENYNKYLGNSIEDIIFENRNKAYGAYQLRKYADRSTIVAILFGAALTTVIAFVALSQRSDDIVKTTKTIISTVTDIKLPDIPKVEVLAPQPPAAPPVDLNTIKVVNLNPVNDQQVTNDDLTKISDIKNTTISTVTNTSVNTTTPILKEPIKSGPVTNTNTGSSTVFKFVEHMPEPIGGMEAMQRWLAANIRYPKWALDSDVDGIVYVEFVINTDGSISDAKVIRGIGFGCDEEAIRAVENMPAWKPGTQNGNAVRVKTTIPIKFEVIK